MTQLGNPDPTVRHASAKALSVLVCSSMLVSKSSWAKSTIQALESTLVKAARADRVSDGEPLTMSPGSGGNSAPAAMASRAGGLLALAYVTYLCLPACLPACLRALMRADVRGCVAAWLHGYTTDPVTHFVAWRPAERAWPWM